MPKHFAVRRISFWLREAAGKLAAEEGAMASSYEVIINQHGEGRIITADSAKMALVQALGEAIQWVARADWPEDACTITVSVVKGE
jgi:hypothetical protein